MAYANAPFGPLVVQQLLTKVSSVLVHARCSASHKTGAYTLSFFEIRGRTVQPRLKSSKADGQTGEAMEDDSASDVDDQQKPPTVTDKGQAPGMLMYFCLFLL